jgi:hypothetical protein
VRDERPHTPVTVAVAVAIAVAVAVAIAVAVIVAIAIPDAGRAVDVVVRIATKAL